MLSTTSHSSRWLSFRVIWLALHVDDSTRLLDSLILRYYCSFLCVLIHVVHEGQTRLSEIHDLEGILSVLFGVPNAKIKPLLMPASVSVYLHVELILGRRDHLGLQEVTRLEDGVKHEDLVIIFL